MKIEEFLEYRLKQQKIGMDLRVNLISSLLEDDESQKLSEFQKNVKKSISRLILVSQTYKQKDMFVLALSTQEHYTESSLNGYIQYVDSSGFCEPRNLQSKITKCFISSYLEYCKEYTKMNAIYLFSCSKPEYIFGNSEYNSLKKPLEGQALVKFWIKTISLISGMTVHVYNNDFSNSLLQYAQSCNPEIDWKSDMPYEAKKLAKDVVLVFQDDPKYQHLLSVKEDLDRMQARDFFNTICCRAEFANQFTAFIKIDFCRKGLVQFGNEQHDLSKPSIRQSIEGLLLKGDFTSLEKCLKCSETVLKLINPLSKSFKTLPFEEHVKQQESVSVNNLQSLIKRRKC